MLKNKHEIENYEEKSKTLLENGWETWYHNDNWIKTEWWEQGKKIDMMGRSTDDVYGDIIENLKHIKRFNEAQENLNISDVSDSDFIFNSLRNKLDEQEDKVVEYMNKYMTQEERNRHGDNIWGLLVRSQGLISQISLEMIADGRKIK
jgi:hypothetical protein